ncbi:uncharacterized protein LOC125498888 [Beta vulgaris subsp. vulgaris]|uniref:uncharacterized protein LOC125498888 n=1 Tax=Beta vulgaris subsp. vulgaris TaxID=3555 RepID=UPI002036822C|nr:uncharacterized protein LOC125498888 [Beta vulgaris subsp. vulgaris]
MVESSDEVVVVEAGVIGGKNVASDFIEDDIDNFLEKSELSISTKVRAPTSEERPNDCPKGWVVLYEYPFKIGYKFPLNSLMTQLLSVMQVSPAQIMPLVWRVVHVIDKLAQDANMEFTLEDILYMYEIKRVEVSRYTFFLKPGKHSLVENSGANDRGWKKRYFFVNKKSMGKSFDYLHDGWNSEEILPLPVEESVYSRTKINQLLKKYSAKERMFRNKFELTPSDGDILPQSTEEHTANTNEPTNDTSPSMASEMLERARKRKQAASTLTVMPSSMGAPKATQNSLALRSDAITLEKECKTLREKLERSSSALMAAEKKVTELSAELAKEKNQNASHVANMTSMKEETDATIANLREELMDAASRYTWKTKARLMKQFLDGQTSKWTPEADIRQFLEVFRTQEDLVPEGENSVDVTATADSGVNTETDGVA